MSENMNVVINNRDRDFFKFEEMSNQIINKYVEEHSDCDVHSDEGLRKVLSNLLIQNVKVSITDSGNISKTICGHKIKDIRNKDNSLNGISITLYGNYEDKTRVYTDLTEFNEWYENKINDCKNSLNKSINKSVKVDTKSEVSCFNSVVFSINGNDYCFDGLSGYRFVFKKNEDNGIRFSLDRLVS